MKGLLYLLSIAILCKICSAQAPVSPTPSGNALSMEFVVVNPPISMCLPFNSPDVSVTIYWGDGSPPETIVGPTINNVDHTYNAPGTFTISIDRYGPGPVWLPKINGGYSCWYDRLYPGTNARLTKILSFGDLGLQSLRYGFTTTFQLTDVPPLLPSTVTDLQYAFSDSGINSPSILSWDIRNVNQIEGLFYNARFFNQPIGSWNVSHLTSMRSLFHYASAFNQPLASWDVSKVTDFQNMFYGASAFNQPLDSWNVAQATNMAMMFIAASSFNQPLLSWDVSRVTSMESMFQGANNYNQPLNTWNVGNVVQFQQMFLQNAQFNQSLNMWNMTSATSLYRMFESSRYNQPLDLWDVSNVRTIGGIFSAAEFNQPINTWNVAQVTAFDYAFFSTSKYNWPLDNWPVPSGVNFNNMFDQNTVFLQNITNWCAPALNGISPPNFAPNLPAIFQPDWTACLVVPSAPPVQPPLAPPVQPPLAPPVQPPEAPPVRPPVQPPLAPPIQPPDGSPVRPPVQPPEAPPVRPPVQPPEAPPVQEPAQIPEAPPVSAPIDPPMSPPNAAPISPPVAPPACAGSTCITQNVTLQTGDVVSFENSTVIVGDFKIVSSAASVTIKIEPTSTSSGTTTIVPLQITGCAQFQGNLNVSVPSQVTVTNELTVATFQQGYCGGALNRTSFDSLNVDLGCRQARQTSLQYNPTSLSLLIVGVDNTGCNNSGGVAAPLNMAGIIGGSIAGAVVIAAIIGTILFIMRRRRHQREADAVKSRMRTAGVAL